MAALVANHSPPQSQRWQKRWLVINDDEFAFFTNKEVSKPQEFVRTFPNPLSLFDVCVALTILRH